MRSRRTGGDAATRRSWTAAATTLGLGSLVASGARGLIARTTGSAGTGPTATGAWVATASDPSRGAAALTGVAAVGPAEAYAVGAVDRPAGLRTVGRAHGSYAERWDGTSWTATPIRVPACDDTWSDALVAVAAVAPSDVWAVGHVRSRCGRDRRTLAVHWDGRAWIAVPTPDPGACRELHAVAAGGPDDVWAVGGFSSDLGHGSLAIHWDGSSWRRVAVRNVGSLDAVTVAADHTVYVAGPQGVVRSVGSGWARLPALPAPSGGGPFAGRVTALAHRGHQLWAVGADPAGSGHGDRHGYAACYEAGRWAAVDPHPVVGLVGVVATPTGVTAVGSTTVVALTPAPTTEEMLPGTREATYTAIAADRVGRLWVVGPASTATRRSGSSA